MNADLGVGAPCGPTISIVVPTMNRIASLRRFLDSIEDQATSHDAEIVVISDGSTDGTNEMLKAYDTSGVMTVLCQENAGPAAARNAGVRAASGEVIVFLDDDVVAQNDLLTRHRALHGRSAPLAVIGPMRTPHSELSPWTGWEQRLLEEQYRAMTNQEQEPGWREFYTGNASVRRDVFLEVGGFDTSYRRGEDVELAKRLASAGVRFEFAADAEVLHYPERSRSSWLVNAELGGRESVRMAGADAVGLLSSEYRERHPLMKTMVRSLAGRAIAPMAQQTFFQCGLLAHKVRAGTVSHLGLSAAYNLGYFNAAALAFGGRRAFLDQVAT